MNLSFIFFVFINIVIILGMTYRFYGSGEEFGALIILAGFIGAAVFFGLRWFTGKGEMKNGAGPWPPLLNTCPDFLTLHTVNNEQVCIDTVGVAKGGKLKKWTDPTQTGEEYLFKLYLDQSADARVKSLCDECSAKGVTWEGIYNGSSCLGREPPKPAA